MSRRWSHCSYSQLPDLKDLESQLSFHLACCALPPGQTSTLHPGHTNSNHNKNPQSQYGVAPNLHKSHLNLLLVVHLWQTRASIPSCVAHDRWKPTRDLSSTASRSHTRRAPTHRQGRATPTSNPSLAQTQTTKLKKRGHRSSVAIAAEDQRATEQQQAKIVKLVAATSTGGSGELEVELSNRLPPSQHQHRQSWTTRRSGFPCIVVIANSSRFNMKLALDTAKKSNS